MSYFYSPDILTDMMWPSIDSYIETRGAFKDPKENCHMGKFTHLIFFAFFLFGNLCKNIVIQLLEFQIPTPAPARPSQKASSGDILGTKRGIRDPLVSKRPETILNKEKYYFYFFKSKKISNNF